ncbi:MULTISPECIES: inorganic phosphate transporter [unclassified Adlercreutzia]|uniref:inorganic phosphate transporter n=1 Tax=unclassified Adlercreutzia TaxID=2636013 RepID=UPI0013EDD8B4|nr:MULTISPECIES: inorganic phosphate transporter [unclassified Adlercreutzia]
MDFGLVTVAQAMMGDPALALIVVLTLGATVVNGATDAPNAIATVVGTRAMGPNAAIAMAAVCNFIGLVGITMISSAVAKTIFGMVDFGGDNHAALVALAAAMVAIIVWGVAAWYFGIPTSQSHSLIAGITGAAIALQGGLAGVNGAEWVKVIYGLLVSTCLGFGSGWLFMRLLKIVCRDVQRAAANKAFRWLQIISGAGVAVLHGAQDGQKFLSLCMLGIMLGVDGVAYSDVNFPLWVIVLVSMTMALGTAVGGRKIIKSVGMNMVRMDQAQGFSACVAACFCIGLATFTGLPVSTTHTKTTAIMGVGAEKSIRSVKWNLVGSMILTWVLTFPGCGLLAFAFTHVFLAFM